MKKVGIFFLVCCVYIIAQAEIIPKESSKISYKNGFFYLSNNTKKRKIFVNDPVGPPSKIGVESFCFDGVTVYTKGHTNGVKDSTILFVGTKKGLLSRLVFMEGYVAFRDKKGKPYHEPRYFKDNIAENVGGQITKIKNNSQGDVTVHYRKGLEFNKATYRFCRNEWKKI